jgi:hypothetical protein
MYAYMNEYMYVCMYVCVLCMYVSMYVCRYVCIICVCVCMYVSMLIFGRYPDQFSARITAILIQNVRGFSKLLA